jgi:putative Holliday junction resolvase
MRVLALDWGEVRIGAAVSDEGGQFAFALKQVIDAKKAMPEIKKIIEESQVKKIILGLPKNLAGEEGLSAQKLRKFADQLFAETQVPISLVDERFTTMAATKQLRESGMKEKNQRQIKDNIAAQIMLQQYLDTNKK